jgi:hypothetical protein
LDAAAVQVTIQSTYSPPRGERIIGGLFRNSSPTTITSGIIKN